MYELQFTHYAQKQFLKLPQDIQKRIKGALERARILPQRHFERLVDDSAYKLRVGDYRIIAEIYADRLVIIVIEIGHRRNIYKK
jgi:mRNA interferase RelE/StbE